MSNSTHTAIPYKNAQVSINLAGLYAVTEVPVEVGHWLKSSIL